MVEQQQPTRAQVRDRYKAVNGAWPVPKDELPPLSAQEAVSAFRILYRHRFEKSWAGKVRAVKGRHRRTWNHGRVTVNGKAMALFIVAPDAGWHAFIHDLSHWTHRRQYPAQSPHRGGCHAAVEMDLIEQVVNRGWLQGGLKRQVKPKLKPDLRMARASAVDKRVKAWTTKLRRAETALKKLKRQQAYYRKRVAA